MEETKRTDTPWYYWAALAWLHEENGRSRRALQAGRRAVSSARGRATRIQWLCAQIQRILRLAPDDPMLGPTVTKLIDLLLANEDAWLGRNQDKVDEVTAALERLSQIHPKDRPVRRPTPSVAKSMSRDARRLAARCQRVPPPGKKHCIALAEAFEIPATLLQRRVTAKSRPRRKAK